MHENYILFNPSESNLIISCKCTMQLPSFHENNSVLEKAKMNFSDPISIILRELHCSTIWTISYLPQIHWLQQILWSLQIQHFGPIWKQSRVFSNPIILKNFVTKSIGYLQKQEWARILGASSRMKPTWCEVLDHMHNKIYNSITSNLIQTHIQHLGWKFVLSQIRAALWRKNIEPLRI